MEERKRKRQRDTAAAEIVRRWRRAELSSETLNENHRCAADTDSSTRELEANSSCDSVTASASRPHDVQPPCCSIAPALHHIRRPGTPALTLITRFQAACPRRRTVVIDLETSGFGPEAEIVEAAAIELIDGINTGRCFYSMVRWQRPVHPIAASKHGLSPADQCLASNLRDVLPRLLAFVFERPESAFSPSVGNDSTAAASPLTSSASELPSPHRDGRDLPLVVGHSLRFDWGCLQAAAYQLGISLPKLGEEDQLCTLALFRQLYPLQAASLSDCCRFVGIPRNERRTHTAFFDAYLTAHLFSRLSSIVLDSVDQD